MPHAITEATTSWQPRSWEADGLRLHVLATGSRGNASLVESPDGVLLVDCGISCRQILARCQAVGVDPSRICAILITHEHADHTAGLAVTARKLRVPVYAGPLTRASTRWPQDLVGCPDLDTLQPVRLGPVQVTPFEVPHDAPETLGFRFERAGTAIGFCTDIGHLCSSAAEQLYDTDILALEANHDPEMLRSYPGYPAHLKERIAGDSGHLSNHQHASALAALVSSRTRVVVGMHISEHTNSPALCRRVLGYACRELDMRARRLHPLACLVAGQARPCPDVDACCCN